MIGGSRPVFHVGMTRPDGTTPMHFHWETPMPEPQHVPTNVEVGMTDTDELIGWLRAQLDDDERVAREANGRGHARWVAEPYRESDADRADIFGAGGLNLTGHGALASADAHHIARWDPARVLAEVDAKRRIINELARIPGDWVNFASLERDRAEELLRLLALPYAGRSGYRDEWKP